MKKIFFLALLLSFFAITNSYAQRAFVDKFGNPTASGKNALAKMCMQNCPGYSVSVKECPDGFDLVTCEASNCGDYHKCEQSPCAPGYSTTLKDCPIAVQPDNYLCSKCK